MIDSLRAVWRSAGFRLAFHYGVAVAITMLAVLAIVYLQTVGVLHQRMVRQLNATTQLLTVRFDEGGIDALSAAISSAIADGRNSDSEIYWLADAHGNKRAGNLDTAPAMRDGASAGQLRVLRAGENVLAYLVERHLPDGSLLVVGIDLRDQEAVELLVARASAAAGIVAIVLLIGGTFVFRQLLERSVGAVRRTAARIAAGELQVRVAPSGDEDEFALLEQDINAMLDRIQSLMDGVRHVSNTIAHNLRTPLTRILMRLREAERELGPDAAQHRAIAESIREIEELTVVFEKLLQIAEAEAGARRRHFAPVPLHTIADDVAELYEAVAELQGARLLRDPAGLAVAPGDKDLLAGAVVNLVDNALKYAGSGAVVRIGTRTAEGLALITVQDDGPGIPAAEQENVGKHFHRLDRSTPGHGLGLASVRAVVALHGGRLRLSNADPGLQACIELPAAGD